LEQAALAAYRLDRPAALEQREEAQVRPEASAAPVGLVPPAPSVVLAGLAELARAVQAVMEGRSPVAVAVAAAAAHMAMLAPLSRPL
jgi:hypothetical protein